jgi:hypothetical protein
MNKDWQIYAVITAGVVAIVYAIKSAAKGGGSSSGSNTVVGSLTSAATEALVNQSGNATQGAVIGAASGIADQGLSFDDDLNEAAYGSIVATPGLVPTYDTAQLVYGPGTPQYAAAQQYAAEGYPGD